MWIVVTMSSSSTPTRSVCNLGEAGARAARDRGVTSTRYSRLVRDRMDRYSDLDTEGTVLRTESVSLTAGASTLGENAAPAAQPAAVFVAPAVARYARTALDRPWLALLM